MNGKTKSKIMLIKEVKRSVEIIRNFTIELKKHTKNCKLIKLIYYNLNIALIINNNFNTYVK